CEYLLAQGVRVFGGDMLPEWSHDKVGYSTVDILDVAELTRLLKDAAPTQVYHLAGVSYPPDADASPRRSLDINIMGCVSLLDAVREACPQATALVVGSSKVYDDTVIDGPVSEDAPVAPRSFYGISKYAAEMIGGRFVSQMGLDVRFTRSFNHTGPGQSPRFVCSDWASQIAAMNTGQREPALRVGDTSVEIDFTDVRDVVRAYHAIVTAGTRGRVYNVCSGRTVPLRTVLDYLCAKSTEQVAVTTDESRMRGHATSRKLTGDSRRLREETGWEPRIPLEQTLDDLFAYWQAVSD
ncbi:MAG: NAD-dependent epimerase/dehydratase family protein, partial [Chitinivibrionales bacterium]|nr:NAD-dependent epimerase/dehydratase family protein [Chitinivibrionales bacterium]